MNWDFWVITGIDYSGKTTILRKIAKTGIPSLHWSDLREVKWIRPILERPYDIVFEMGPMTRASFLLLVASTMYEYAMENNITLIDSFWYRFYVKEKIFGLSDIKILEALFNLPKPKAVFYIELSPNIALKRCGGKFTPYESFSEKEEDFIRFQSLLDRELKELLKYLKLNVIYIDGTENLNYIANKMISIIKKETLL